MAQPIHFPEIISPKLYITQVSDDHKLLKISGQMDKETSVLIESLIETNKQRFDEEISCSINNLFNADPKKTIYIAKFTDGSYYRAKIVSGINAEKSSVRMYFIDYGNTDEVLIKNIRVLSPTNPLSQIKPTASNFYLAGILSSFNVWHPKQLEILNNILNYTEYNICSQSNNYPLISIEYKNTDLTTYLLNERFGIQVPIIKQELMLLSFKETMPQPRTHPDINSYNEGQPNKPRAKEPFPLNMATMKFTRPPPIVSTRPPSAMNPSPTLVNNPRPPFLNNFKPPFGNFSVPPPIRNAMPSALLNIKPPPTVHNPSASKQLHTFKQTILDINSTHKVLVSYVSNQTGNFTVQLQTSLNQLKYMMNEINKHQYPMMSTCPTIGEVCLGRSAYIKMIARAIVSTVTSQGCQLYFVDYGGDEFVHYYDVFDIPQEYVLPPTIAIKMCLSDIQNLNWNYNLNKSFRELVSDKVLTLRVMPPEGPPLVQYGELYYNQCNILNLIMADERLDFEFVILPSLSPGYKESVLVSYVDSCLKFFVQLTSNIDELNLVMKAVKVYCERSVSPGELAAGSACCARFPDDGNWYRAKVVEAKGQRVVVAYVDYGNEQEVHVNDLRSITNSLTLLPAQAIKCALKGYEKRSIDAEISNKFEKLTLEKILTVHVVGKYSSDTMLVSLLDDNVSPPVDINKKMSDFNMTDNSTHGIYKTPPQVKRDDKGKTDYVAKSTLPTKDNREPDNWRDNRQRNNERSPNEHHAPNKRDETARKGERSPINENNAVNNKRDKSVNRNWRSQNNEISLSNTKRDGSAQRTDGDDRRDQKCSRDRKPRNTSQSHGSPPEPEARTRHVVDPAPDDAEYADQDLEGAVLDVVVTWLTSPENFYVQPLRLQSALEDMMREIPELYRGVCSGAGQARAVLARYPEDRALYRADVLERRPPSHLLVRYVDFGNKALVADTDVWRLTVNLMRTPRLAVYCALAGVRAKSGADRTRLDQCFGAERYVCTVGALLPDGRRSVTLKAPDGSDVAATLISAGLVDAEQPVTTPVRSVIGTPHYVAHVDSPGQFWLHTLENANRLERLQEELAARAETFPPLEECVPGARGCARYSADERWYRAEVLDADADITTVRFVDYGNTDVLGPAALRRLPEDLAAPGPLALRCKLHAAPGGTGEWSEAASDRFTALLLAVPEVDARVLLGGVTLYVELRADGVDPATVLVAEGLASADRESREPCFASHVGSPDEFWIQLESATSELQEIEEAMAAALSFPVLAAAEEGALVAAEFPEDGAWYRARVVARGSEGMEVLFVDYGNSCMASELRALPAELSSRPALSRKCALRQGPAGGWGRRAGARFEELAAEGATVFNVQFVASGDLSVVDLYLNEGSVADELLALDDIEDSCVTEADVLQPEVPQAQISLEFIQAKIQHTEETDVSLQIKIAQNDVMQTTVLQFEDQHIKVPQTPQCVIPRPEVAQTDIQQSECQQSEVLQIGTPQIGDTLNKVSQTNNENPKSEISQIEVPQTANQQNETLHDEVPYCEVTQTDIPQIKDPRNEIQQTEDPQNGSEIGAQSEIPRTEILQINDPRDEVPQTGIPQNDSEIGTQSEIPRTEILQINDPRDEVPQTGIPQNDSEIGTQSEIPRTEVSQTETLQINDPRDEVPQTEIPQNDSEIGTQSEIPRTEVSQTEILQINDPRDEVPQTGIPQNDSEIGAQSEIPRTEVSQTETLQINDPRDEVPQTEIPQNDSEIGAQSEIPRIEVSQTEILQINDPREVPQTEIPQNDSDIGAQSEIPRIEVSQTEILQINDPREVPQTEIPQNDSEIGAQSEIPRIEVSQTEILQINDPRDEVPQTGIPQNDSDIGAQSEIPRIEVSQTEILQINDPRDEVPQTGIPQNDSEIGAQSEIPRTEVSQTETLQINDPRDEVPQTEIPQNDSEIGAQSEIPRTEVAQTDIQQTECQKSEIPQIKDPHNKVSQTKNVDPKSEIQPIKVQTGNHHNEALHDEVPYCEVTQTDKLQINGQRYEVPQTEILQNESEIAPQSDISRNEVSQTDIIQTDVLQNEILQIREPLNEVPQNETDSAPQSTVSQFGKLQSEDLDNKLWQIVIPQTEDPNSEIPQTQKNHQTEITRFQVPQSEVPQIKTRQSEISRHEFPQIVSEIPENVIPEVLPTKHPQCKQTVIPDANPEANALHLEFPQNKRPLPVTGAYECSQLNTDFKQYKKDTIIKDNLDNTPDSNVNRSESAEDHDNHKIDNIHQDDMHLKEEIVLNTCIQTDDEKKSTIDTDLSLTEKASDEILEENSFIDTDSINENSTFKSCDLEDDYENEFVMSNEFQDAEVSVSDCKVEDVNVENYSSLNNDVGQSKIGLQYLVDTVILKSQNLPTEEHGNCHNISDSNDVCDINDRNTDGADCTLFSLNERKSDCEANIKIDNTKCNEILNTEIEKHSINENIKINELATADNNDLSKNIDQITSQSTEVEFLNTITEGHNEPLISNDFENNEKDVTTLYSLECDKSTEGNSVNISNEDSLKTISLEDCKNKPDA